MSVTYGFYNAINHDRAYNAAQMSSLFDGIINDGVFQSIGTAMIVKAESGMKVSVGIGRAWFNHTWTNNDSKYVLSVPSSESVYKRLDAVVLEVNASDSVRANSFKIIKGTPSTKPVAPTLVDTTTVHQHLLATILVEPLSNSISDSKITNYVGTKQTPFITGILKTLDASQLYAKWDESYYDMSNEWSNFFHMQTDSLVKAMTDLVERSTTDIEQFEEKAVSVINEIQQRFEDVLSYLEQIEIEAKNELDQALEKIIGDTNYRIESLITYYVDKFVEHDEYFNYLCEHYKEVFDEFERDIRELQEHWNDVFEEFYIKNSNKFLELINDGDERFNSWFIHLQDELTSNQAANLQRQIDALKFMYVSNDILYLPATTASVVSDTIIFPY